jgi:RNA polymerase sigma-70 factor (ECF subfamily)
MHGKGPVDAVTGAEAATVTSVGRAPLNATEFAAWVDPYRPKMWRLAVRLTSVDDGEDIVQEALIRAWRARGQFDPARGTPSAWLLKITADRARRRSRRNRSAWFDISDPAGSMPAPEGRLDVEAAVARLAERQRLAVSCVYFVGLTVAETAAVMGCAEGTVKSTLADARARLRPWLEVRDGRS